MSLSFSFISFIIYLPYQSQKPATNSNALEKPKRLFSPKIAAMKVIILNI